MNIAICDDDEYIVNELYKHIESFFSNKNYEIIIQKFYNGEALLDSKTHFDLLFIDIEMPGINGLYTCKKLLEDNNVFLIFIITAFQYYLDDAMELNVYRYILKPIDKKRLIKNLEFAFKRFLLMDKPLDIKIGEEIYRINASDIIYINIENRKVHIHTYGKELISTEPFSIWKERLHYCFFASPHHSYIVNMQYISCFSKNTVTLVCRDKKYEAYVSSRKYKSFKNSFYAFVGGTSW